MKLNKFMYKAIEQGLNFDDMVELWNDKREKLLETDPNGEKHPIRELEGGGKQQAGVTLDVGDGYRVPSIEEFVDGFEYERTDGGKWFPKTYKVTRRDEGDREYDKGSVERLIPQWRVRVKE